MKALIFNSGTGSRMGKLTESCPKCLLKLGDGESIFARQLRILAECGITEAVVTTGKYEQELFDESRLHPEIKVTFVNNPLYESTNYIYSMHLAGRYLDDDMLILHGDLVFDKHLVEKILSDSRKSLCLVNPDIAQPDKDFKGRIENGRLAEVGVNISGGSCYALQPMYKLSREDVQKWFDEVNAFVEKGVTDVYAENAFNAIAGGISVYPLSYSGYYINEIDVLQDYERVCREISMADSGVCFGISSLKALVERYGAKRPFAVTGRHIKGSAVDSLLCELGMEKGRFFGVVENPDDECVESALKAFADYGGDMLISIGGGSAMDTAKAVKYHFCRNNKSSLVHIAVPTTAGSGSEATPFSVITSNGAKRSIADSTLLPENAVLDSTLLYSMNEQQRKVSLLDALCHSVESLMTKGSNDESRGYAVYSIKLILKNYADFVVGNTSVYDEIFAASYYAGKAISITKTAVGHAMSYSLTTNYGVRHGQAAALCLISAFRQVEKASCQSDVIDRICTALECSEKQSISDRLTEIYTNMKLLHPFDLSGAEPFELAKRVNTERLGNSAIPFTEKDVFEIYSDVKNRI